MHAYSEVGLFHARVTVTDGKGGSDRVLVPVAVMPFGPATARPRSASVASCRTSCR